MSYQKIPLLAGQAHRLDIAGKLLLIDSPGVAGSVDVAMVNNGTPGITMEGRKGGFKRIAKYDGVILKAAVDTVVTLFLDMDDVQLGTNQLEINNSVGNPVHVDIAGVVAPVFGDITNSNANAVPVKKQELSTIVDIAPVNINVGAAQALISDATLKRLRIRNGHATARLAIGGAGVTLLNAPIVLEPGGLYIEEDAAGAAWFATSDTAATNVQLQGLK